jgi:hypothetical protein
LTKALEAISKFLLFTKSQNSWLVDRWNKNLEVQVNPSPEGGTPSGDKGNVYTDGLETWFPIRIPKEAMSEPKWSDFELNWRLDLHAESIGSTWWDWVNKESVAVGFDFDSIAGHAVGVGVDESTLESIKTAAAKLPYINVLRSRGGAGIHLYIFFEEGNRPKTATHTEHAAVAKKMLEKMSQDVGFDFSSHLDVCGGNMWLWSKHMGERGFEVVKEAEILLVAEDVAGWEDYIGLKANSPVKKNEALAPFSKDSFILDAEHIRILEALESLNYTTSWNDEKNLCQTHTCALAELAETTEIRGYFETSSSGNNPGTPNCFMMPVVGGFWAVYRFGEGTREADTWQQDGSSWTRCYFNKPVGRNDLRKVFKFKPRSAGWNHTDSYDMFAKFCQAMKIEHNFHDTEGFEALVRIVKTTDQMDVKVRRRPGLACPVDWLETTDYFTYFLEHRDISTEERMAEAQAIMPEMDAFIRSVISTGNTQLGWFVCTKQGWVPQVKENIKSILTAKGFDKVESEHLLGELLLNQWTSVDLPFHPEEPGGRRWNMNAVQLAFDIGEPGGHPHWDLIFDHCGESLTEYIQELDWAEKWGITTGREYLQYWVSCLIKEPFEPLPYLFFYGPQESGKSIFHEGLSLLFNKGVVKADRALTSQSDYNGELKGAIVGVVDEVDITEAGARVYNKIKEWVTGRKISIRHMYKEVYEIPNSLHFIQTANSQTACPIFDGDTRITMAYVGPIVQEIPKPILMAALEDEAPGFLGTILGLELGESPSRLRLPCVNTEQKIVLAKTGQNVLESFIEENCEMGEENRALYSDVYEKFLASLSSFERHQWKKPAFTRSLPVCCKVVRGAHNVCFIHGLRLACPEEKAKS